MSGAETRRTMWLVGMAVVALVACGDDGSGTGGSGATSGGDGGDGGTASTTGATSTPASSTQSSSASGSTSSTGDGGGASSGSGGAGGEGGVGPGGAGGEGASGQGGDASGGGGGSPPIDTGPVQCRVDDDCDSGDCNRDAPGGICLGCPASDCPGTSECFDGIPACITPCEEDVDCNAGFTCGGTGRCLLRTCDENVDCAPYVCGDGGQCQRPACPGGDCPAGFDCVAAVCVEAR